MKLGYSALQRVAQQSVLLRHEPTFGDTSVAALMKAGTPAASAAAVNAIRAAGVEFIQENGGGAGVRLRKERHLTDRDQRRAGMSVVEATKISKVYEPIRNKPPVKDEQCRGAIDPGWFHSRQCSKAPRYFYGDFGFCSIHDPVNIEDRRARRDAKRGI